MEKNTFSAPGKLGLRGLFLVLGLFVFLTITSFETAEVVVTAETLPFTDTDGDGIPDKDDIDDD